MKALLFRATAPAVTLASCLVMFGGVASAQSATITDTGRDSTNEISSKNICIEKVKNDTNVWLSNTSVQTANSGSANVKNNDDVGNVTTGNASNTNSSSFSLSVSNNTGSCLGNSMPAPQSGGQGGMGGGGQVTTPAATQAASTTTSTVAPSGGLGGGEVAAVPVASQVAVVPTGGVGAGEGGPAYLAGLISVTLASGALAATRLSRSYKSRV